MKILQNWLKISWFSLTVKFVCEGPVANFTLPLLKVYDKELLWIEATWITLHGESVLLCFPYVTEQWNLRGGGGGGIIIEQLSSLSFSFPLPPLLSICDLSPAFCRTGSSMMSVQYIQLGKGSGEEEEEKGCWAQTGRCQHVHPMGIMIWGLDERKSSSVLEQKGTFPKVSAHSKKSVRVVLK